MANERVCHNLLLSEDLGTWDAVFDVVSTLALETKALVSNRNRKKLVTDAMILTHSMCDFNMFA